MAGFMGGAVKWAEEEEEEEEIWVKHYSSLHQILLVGEGDFSFSLSLAKAFRFASNIVTTSLDTHDVVIKKYSKAKSNIVNIVKLGAMVLHGVDATKMKLHTDLSMRKFDYIIFNFPHAGFHGKEDEIHLIKSHRNLVQSFFWNASRMLRPYGEVHVSHKTSVPYNRWNLEELASNCSLTLTECVPFEKEDYPGYDNKRGDGLRCDEPFRLGECSTFKFIIDTRKVKKTSEAMTALRGQSLLDIPETLEESQCGNARSFDRNNHLICYPQTSNTAAMQVMSGTPHGSLRHPERNAFSLSVRNLGVDFSITSPFIRGPVNHAETIILRTECLRIFDGYFRHNHEMFGRTDYDFRSALQGFLINGCEMYMNEQPGRTVHGYVRCLQELRHLTVLRLAQLRRKLLSPDS